jgi:hypothetical protein
MDVKVHTIGRITAGKYKGWYVFIQTYRKYDHYLIVIANNKRFGKDKNGHLIKGTVGYDDWMPNIESVENLLDDWNVEWLDGQKPKWLPDEAD